MLRESFVEYEHQHVCWFPIAAVTNYHKLSDLKHKLIVLEFWKYEI